MRSDYLLYVVAIICFIVTGAVAMAVIEQRELWIVTTVVLGLVFVGLGYSQRPHETMTTEMVVAQPPPPTLQKVTDLVEEKKIEPMPQPVVEIKSPTPGLLEVKGIKDKRAQQLRTLGVNSVEDLANASAEDLAAKLKISPYFTGKWIEEAKRMLQKS